MNLSKGNETNTTSPVYEIFSQLGRPCAVPIIFALGERSYNTDIHELRNSIDSKKLTTTTISKCLSDLTAIGLVEGAAHAKSPSEAEYSLTSKGQQLYKHLLQIRFLSERVTTDQDFFDSVSAC